MTQNARRSALASLAALLVLTGILSAGVAHAESAAELPAANGTVVLPAQEWPLKPGPRTIKVYVFYPGGQLKNVKPSTGLMLSIHNWGGHGADGTASPTALAERLDVVAIAVDYLQSGDSGSNDIPEPYEHGYLQALDALRALEFVFDGLKARQIPFAAGRIFATGGSGGGNVTLMVNKLAPRTFTCIIDMCGMSRLTDATAFHLPGAGLNARYSRDPKSPAFLSADDQQIRFVGNPEHLKTMKQLQNTCKVIVVHGSEDPVVSPADAREMVENMKHEGFDVEPHFITTADLDGKVFTTPGHGLGNRTAIVFQVAGKYLQSDSPQALVRKTPTDFECRDTKVRYETTHGRFVISYEAGYPVGRFEAKR